MQPRVVQHLVGLAHRRAGHAAVVQQFAHHLGRVALLRPARDYLVECCGIAHARPAAAETRVLEQLGLADRFQQPAHPVRLERDNRHVPVQRRIDPERREPVVVVAGARGIAFPSHDVKVLFGHPRCQAIQHRHLHALALARAAPVNQRGQDAIDDIHRRDQVRDRQAAARRRPIGVASDLHQAAERLDDDVHALESRERTGLAHRLDRRVDDARIALPHLLVVHAELGGSTLAEVLEHDVRFLGQPHEQLAALLRFQVQRDALFVAGPVQDRQRYLAVFTLAKMDAVAAHERRVGPCNVPTTGRFHADHLRAHAAKQQRAIWPGKRHGQVQYADAFKWPRLICWHYCLLSCRPAVMRPGACHFHCLTTANDAPAPRFPGLAWLGQVPIALMQC
ncbi:hypothetical protein D9M69_135330 [compost metagenome]